MHSLKIANEAFLQHCKYDRNFSEHTVKAYRLDLAHFVRFTTETFATEVLAEITREVLREYGRSLHHYKPRTQRRKLAALKSMFGFLEREGHLDHNPAQSLRLGVRLGRLLPRTIGLATLESLFRQVYTQRVSSGRCRVSDKRRIRDVALVELMFSSGMRVSEISHLRVSSVDLQRRSVLIRGKGNKERMIPICGSEVQSALVAHAEVCGLDREADSFFFTNRFGRRLSEQSIRMALKRHAKRAGLEKITPHVFRHTVATMLLEQGVDLRFIQTFLGHSSIVTTTIYAHVNEKSQRDILDLRHPRRLVSTLAAHGGTTR